MSHGCYSSGHNLSGSETLLHELGLQTLLNVYTIRHWTFGIFTLFGMITTESDELLTDQTLVGIVLAILSLAMLGMLNDTLELVARRTATIGVATLASVHETFHASLNDILAILCRCR